MYEAKSKEIVLRRVREALAKSAPFLPPTPDFTSPLHPVVPLEDMSIVFAENFIRNSGKFVYCENQEDFFDQLYVYKKEQNLQHLYVWERNLQTALQYAGIEFSENEDTFVNDAEASLTTCESLITRTGSLLVSSANAGGRRLSIYPSTHMVVAQASQLVPDIKDALQRLRNKYKENNFPSMVSMVSGPSRTADIEKTLVMGAHGPKQLVLFLIDDIPN
ncbi:lactate utilization protein C [Pontibacter toksunensis]|uniref:Lactate utilization protein C n=1 Tax=Pontibacter toksunensis TaxID=1332631 RepID=A0ABW6BSW1_9BACT